MNSAKTKLLSILCLLVSLAFSAQASAVSMASSPSGLPQNSASAAATRRIGIIKAINGNSITLTPLPPDTGAEAAITVSATTRILRIAPGEKTLKNAAALQLQDLQVGDHILVGGKPSDDGKSINAVSVVVMKASDVAAKQQQDQQDWQKRGMGGLVSAVDPSTGTVTISVTSFAGKKNIAVKTSPSTIFRRYAPDSMKFDDAKPSSLQEIHPGDQLRARGDRNADGSEVTAEEIVTGNFRNIAGTVNSVDASAGTLNVQDLSTKKPVVIKVSSDSQMHQLPAEMAQRIAMRLKGAALGAGAAGAATAGSGAAGSPSSAASGAGASGAGWQQSHSAASGGSAGGSVPAGGSADAAGGGMGAGMRPGGAPDFNQMLSRMPAVALADLHKGDAVMIVATEGSPRTASTAITLVSGVDPILRASPTAGQAMMLAPWSLGAPAGDAASQ